mmetsp:Transcript_36344/g.75620  ORF Transcript_36344/g.75620 Transcript_36344/m.75620 type:complete len:364 (+) Transcript_36344:114-1205(+)
MKIRTKRMMPRMTMMKRKNQSRLRPLPNVLWVVVSSCVLPVEANNCVLLLLLRRRWRQKQPVPLALSRQLPKEEANNCDDRNQNPWHLPRNKRRRPLSVVPGEESNCGLRLSRKIVTTMMVTTTKKKTNLRPSQLPSRLQNQSFNRVEENSCEPHLRMMTKKKKRMTTTMMTILRKKSLLGPKAKLLLSHHQAAESNCAARNHPKRRPLRHTRKLRPSQNRPPPLVDLQGAESSCVAHLPRMKKTRTKMMMKRRKRTMKSLEEMTTTTTMMMTTTTMRVIMRRPGPVNPRKKPQPRKLLPKHQPLLVDRNEPRHHAKRLLWKMMRFLEMMILVATKMMTMMRKWSWTKTTWKLSSRTKPIVKC